MRAVLCRDQGTFGMTSAQIIILATPVFLSLTAVERG